MTNYRMLLLSEIEMRKVRNKASSLRSFARDAGCSPAFISQVISGKKRLSPGKAIEIGLNLKWTEKKQEYFLNLVKIEEIGESRFKDALKIKLKKASKQFPHFLNVKEENFQIISEWYHFAILELTELKNANLSPGLMARHLGIKEIECRQAIRRLIVAGLLKEKDNRLFKTSKNYQISNIPSSAVRSFHKQNLARAQKAIDKQSMAEREFIGCTVAINKQQLEKVKKKIADFVNEIMSTLSQGEKTDVYHLGIQLFNVKDN